MFIELGVSLDDAHQILKTVKLDEGGDEDITNSGAVAGKL